MSDLTIFVRHPTMDAYRFGGSFTPYAIIAKDKRFSDAELAAEMWHASDDRTGNAANIMSGDNYRNPHAQQAFQLSIDRAIVIHRFATLPNYDEAGA